MCLHISGKHLFLKTTAPKRPAVPPRHHDVEMEAITESMSTNTDASESTPTDMLTPSDEEEERESGSSIEDIIMDGAKRVGEISEIRHAVVGLSLSLAVSVTLLFACCCLILRNCCCACCWKKETFNPDVELKNLSQVRQGNEEDAEVLGAVGGDFTLPAPLKSSPRSRHAPSPTPSLPFPPPPDECFYEVPITPPMTRTYNLPPTPVSSSSDELYVSPSTHRKMKRK